MSENITVTRTGIALLRLIVANLDHCREDFLDPANGSPFTAEELLQIGRVHLRCECDFYPDQWTPNQVKAALHGVVPEWDRQTEEPIEEPTDEHMLACRANADLLGSLGRGAGHSRHSTTGIVALLAAGAVVESDGPDMPVNLTALGYRAIEILAGSEEE